MPAPYAKKHFLEMSDRERKARRLADLERPGRDAIEGVYPEEFLIPAARGAIKAVEKFAAQRAPKNAPKVDMPGELRPNMRSVPYYMRDNSGGVFKPNQYTPAELEQMRKESARRAKLSQQEQRLERKREYDQKIDREDFAKEAAVSGVRTAGMLATQDAQEYKRGGKVKSHRGDGIAQRGKTKGRFV
jgi:hypothetical protein